MNIDLEKFIANIKQLIAFFIQTFVGILTSPKSTFDMLLRGSEQRERYKIIKIDKLDERPIIFASISLLIGLLIGSSLSIKDAPIDIEKQFVIGTIISYLFIWLLYAIVLHTFAKWFGGKGKISKTISGVLYVLGTLHPLLLLFIYVFSAIQPNTLSYNFALRDLTAYTQFPDWYLVDLFGFNFRLTYYIVNYILTAIFLYFPLSITHQLSIFKILIIYFIGLIVLFVLAILSLILNPIWISNFAF